jgi:hypothetical protein
MMNSKEAVDKCTTAIGMINDVWQKTYGQTMLVDQSVTDAMQACHVSNSFGQSKWPSSSLDIKFESKDFYNIQINKAKHHEFLQTTWDYADKCKDSVAKQYLRILATEWGPDEKGVPMWFEDVVVYTIDTPRGKVFGNLPSEYGESRLREGIQEFVDWQGYDQDTSSGMETVLMALKVINYSAITYFAPTKINKWDQKEYKAAKKKYKVKEAKSLYRVVYLPKKIREYEDNRKTKKVGSLKNGRVGHLRTLHSDYFVNKQGEDILIPPIPDSKGNYPKIIYKVKKPKDLAA